MTNQDDFYQLIDEADNKPIQLLVYNRVWDTCRQVTITPNKSWGGEGSLGCDIGYGYLHRVPGRKERLAAASNAIGSVSNGVMSPLSQPGVLSPTMEMTRPAHVNGTDGLLHDALHLHDEQPVQIPPPPPPAVTLGPDVAESRGQTMT